MDARGWTGLEAIESRASCDHCNGRGFQLDWTDQGGQMRAVPGDTCRKCNGSGETVTHPTLQPKEKPDV